MPDPRARALALFDHYIALTPRERDCALTSLRAADPGVYRALQALLRADERNRCSDGSIAPSVRPPPLKH